MNFNRMALTDLLKEGTRHISGVSDVVLKNIEAVKKISDITRTSMGPMGMNKMVINYLNKLFVTHDAGTITKELEIVHPAAKIAVLAAQSQDTEIGDGTNLVLSLIGELMNQAEVLLRMGLHTSDIIHGYKKAHEKSLEILETLVVKDIQNITDRDEVANAIRASIASKQFGYEDFMAPLIAQACINVCPKNPSSFSVDSVRTLKVNGGSVKDSHIIKGFAIARDVEGSIYHVKDAKIAVFACSIDASSTETKHTVLINSAKELESYNLSEEQAIERDIKAIADSGIKVVVTQGSFGEMAMHFLERYKIMAIKCNSKFQLRRLCNAIGASSLVRVGAPTPEEMGECASVDVIELGDQKIVKFTLEDENRVGLSTIVLRGATNNVLDEIERAVDDGVNCYKSLTRDTRLVAGAGATEVQIYNQLAKYADSVPGVEQYAIRQYGESFLVIPKTLAECSGLDSTKAVSVLDALHQEGKKTMGIDIESLNGKDALKESILDPLVMKYWAIKFATDAAIQILKVDQIIMARPAGGPKPRKNTNWDED